MLLQAFIRYGDDTECVIYYLSQGLIILLLSSILLGKKVRGNKDHNDCNDLLNPTHTPLYNELPALTQCSTSSSPKVFVSLSE